MKKMKYKIEIYQDGILIETVYYLGLKPCNDEKKNLKSNQTCKIIKL